MLKRLLMILALFAVAAHAKDNQIDVNTWHLAVGVGLGKASNPLHGGDDIPLVVLPDIAYYGERFYFDNGQVGYSLSQDSHYSLSMISELNPEKRFFVFWHPSNFFLPMALNSETKIAESVTVNQVKKRRWALDAGLEYQYFSDNFTLKLNWLFDISGVYNDDRAAIEFEGQSEFGSIIISPAIGLHYQSQGLNQYYYGVEQQSLFYDGYRSGSSLSPYFKLQLTWPLTQSSALFIKTSYDDYSSLRRSPLFKENAAMSFFVGMKYIF